MVNGELFVINIMHVSTNVILIVAKNLAFDSRFFVAPLLRMTWRWGSLHTIPTPYKLRVLRNATYQT